MSRRIGKSVRTSGLLIAACGLTLHPKTASAGAFISGSDIVVLREGDGNENVSAGYGNAPAFLDEYSIAGTTATLVNTVAIPSTGTNAVTEENDLSVSSNRDGILKLSGDGNYLSFGGYASPLNTASNAPEPSATTAARVAVIVGADGSINSSTALTDAYTNNLLIRAAVTNDGQEVWTAGSGAGTSDAYDGLRYATLGSTTSTSLNPAANSGSYVDVRSVAIANLGSGNQLFTSSGSSSVGHNLFQVGTGLPTSGSQAFTGLEPAATATSTSDFILLNLNSAQSGDDAMYLTTSSGISKFSLISGTWTAEGSIALTNAEGITGLVNPDGSVTTYITVPTGIDELVDTGGPSGSINALTPTALTGINLGTGADAESIRGIAFAPPRSPRAGNPGPRGSGSVPNVASAALKNRPGV